MKASDLDVQTRRGSLSLDIIEVAF